MFEPVQNRGEFLFPFEGHDEIRGQALYLKDFERHPGAADKAGGIDKGDGGPALFRQQLGPHHQRQQVPYRRGRAHEIKFFGRQGSRPAQVFGFKYSQADGGGRPYVLLTDVGVKQGCRDPTGQESFRHKETETALSGIYTPEDQDPFGPGLPDDLLGLLPGIRHFFHGGSVRSTGPGRSEGQGGFPVRQRQILLLL